MNQWLRYEDGTKKPLCANTSFIPDAYLRPISGIPDEDVVEQDQPIKEMA